MELPGFQIVWRGGNRHRAGAGLRSSLMQLLGESLVRKGGLEPPRFYPPDPKSGASANSATFARAGFSVLRRMTPGKDSAMF